MMSFASLQFIFVFVPAAYLGFLLAHRIGGAKQATNWLAVISLVFYALWGLPLLAILLGSVAGNYFLGRAISARTDQPDVARKLLFGGIAANLLLLSYLKYTNFLIDVADQVTGLGVSHFNIVAPLGVSFYTFVQLGYLVDSYNGKLKPHTFSKYIVFAAFFPCVTAGPLVMQSEMMDQLESNSTPPFDLRRVATGITMFAMGLCKKVLFADSIAPFADSVFGAAEKGGSFDQGTAWIGAISYMLQLYYDFSGYSDMAIGLATIFGIKLPLNFDSPFKAVNISDFWRRWHMTMTRFFTAYIYSGLAMNGMRKSMQGRMGKFGRYVWAAAVPSILTFLFAGIWHGAGWTFIVYGLLHGCAIAAYLGWREFSPRRLPAPAAWFLTMFTVLTGLVIFRAPDLATALSVFKHMYLGGGAGTESLSVDDAQALSMIIILGAIALLLPNSQQILHLNWPVIDTKPTQTPLEAGLLTWRQSYGSAVMSAAVLMAGVASIGSSTAFLYYKF